MKKLFANFCATMAPLALVSALLAGDWTQFGGDPQRTGWAKAETDITKANVKKLKLEWSLKVANTAKELNSLTVPVTVNPVITDKGFKDLVIVAGSADNVTAVDADTGKVFWTRQFTAEGTPRNPGHWLCPNALNATPVIHRRRPGPGLNELNVYLITSDGKLRTINAVNGEDRVAPTQFVPAFSKNWSLTVVNDVIYTATSQGCNGAKSAIYAMDLKDPARPVSAVFATTTGGAGIWGRAGVAVTSDGMVIGETGDGAYDPAAGKLADSFLGVRMEGKELKLADYYTPANRAWITKKDLDMGNMSPIVFKYKDWELVAGSGKEGVIYLLDAKKLGGEDKRTPLFRSKLLTNEEVHFAGRGFWGAMATYESEKGDRWLYAPAWGPQAPQSDKFEKEHGETPDGSIMAFKVDTVDGKPVLKNVWRSRNMNMAEPPVVVNGMVFAISSGENVKQVDANGRLLSSADRANAPAGKAVIYAFDAETGAELWNSGDAMKSFTHFGGLAVANGRIFAVAYDNTLYAFSTGGE
ncbi:MAG: PQQ-binding-like beta-propeller repeat protein [Bryobacteraceae bacterium]|nr:PQQ-binding-like beta-propeller repeat protein [Bryobacteraceae bacterium]